MKKETSYDDLYNELTTYIKSSEELEIIDKAYSYAMFCHKDKFRKNGETYISHPINVALILAGLNTDYITIAAALLHETINHGGATYEDILASFGQEIAKIVSSVSKINKLTLSDDREITALNLRKVLVGLAEDVRVLYIKLADRLHNMRTIWAVDNEEKKNKITETKNVLIPIAHRLGINSIKSELEDLCLKYSKPDIYNEILERLDNTKEELNSKLQEMKDSISNILREHNIKFTIKSRVKSVHSIYEKMVNGHKFDEIYDILALRIITEKINDCYLAIGLIHAKYRPLPGRFKDYIAMPKENMYQSLHTSVFGVDGYVFEVQIRTYEMDDIAEKGIASHWSYKEHTNGSKKNLMEEKLELFRSLIEQSNINKSDLEFEKSMNDEFLGKMIYCFTPKGDVVELPSNATPIDFAYRIHSHVGDTCTGAIVNDKIVTLDSCLHDNDVVMIKTQSNSTPKKEWLNFVKTTQAKNKIKSFFSKKDKDNYIELGKNMLEKEIRRRKLSLSEVLSDEHINKLITDLKMNDLDEIYLSIGSLRYTPIFIINSIYEDKRDVNDVLIEKVNKNNNIKKSDYKSDIIVNGENNIKVNLANCCKPIYGDDIVGYVTRGQGISIHKRDCPNILDIKDRLIDVEWNNNSESDYLTDIIIYTDAGKNHLLDIIALASSKNIYVEAVNTNEEIKSIIYKLTLKVKSLNSLNDLITQLNNLPFISNVKRIID